MLAKAAVFVIGGLVVGSLMGYFGKCTSGACPLTATPVRGALYGGLLGLMMSMVALGGGTSATTSDELITHVTTADEFKAEVLDAKGLVLVDFYADWCGPCKRLAPTLSSLAASQKDKVKIVKVNVDGASALAAAHGVSGIPDMRFFRDGTQVEQVVGLIRKEALFEKIVKLATVETAVSSDDG